MSCLKKSTLWDRRFRQESLPVMDCGSNGNTENPKDYREKENAPTRKKKEEKRTLL